MIKFHKVAAGEYRAYGDTLIYDVFRATGKPGWYVQVHELKRTPGVPDQGVEPTVYQGERVAHTTTDTKSLGYGVCQAYDALGDDYKAHEHGYRSRWTEAVLMAYDDDKVTSGVDFAESLAQMRRGEGTEV